MPSKRENWENCLTSALLYSSSRWNGGEGGVDPLLIMPSVHGTAFVAMYAAAATSECDQVVDRSVAARSRSLSEIDLSWIPETPKHFTGKMFWRAISWVGEQELSDV